MFFDKLVATNSIILIAILLIVEDYMGLQIGDFPLLMAYTGFSCILVLAVMLRMIWD
jgi:hypothetical protein